MFYIQRTINIGGKWNPKYRDFLYSEGKYNWVYLLTYAKAFSTEQEALDKVKKLKLTSAKVVTNNMLESIVIPKGLKV